MNNKSSFRKTIFKHELNYIFEKNNICQADKDRVVLSIFENPLDISKQCLLKKELYELEKLNSKLGEILADNELIGAISSLFLVQEDLELPTEIKDLFLQNEKIGILIGAGISKLINFPLWKELADSAIRHLYDKGLINYFEYQRIVNEVVDPKQKLTIFDNFLPRSTSEAKEFYEKELSKPDSRSENPYRLLVQIDSIKLTSNIDREFYKALDAKLQQTPLSLEESSEEDVPRKSKKAKMIINNFSLRNMDYNTIYHIHGSIDELDQTVLTMKDYIEAYYRNKGGLKDFLSNIFEEYTIIFIGYGLEEFSVLEHLIGGSKQHYVLIGAYLNEMNLFRLKREYFKSLNIRTIPYYLDFNGYYRLNSVLTSWIQLINDIRSKQYYERIEEIDEVID